MNYKLTSDRSAHITATDDSAILAAALEARSQCTKDAAAERLESAIQVADMVRTENARYLGRTVFNETSYNPYDERQLISPPKAGKISRKRGQQVRKAFRFTIEGREGLFRIEVDGKLPVSEWGDTNGDKFVFVRVNGDWNNHGEGL